MRLSSLQTAWSPGNRDFFAYLCKKIHKHNRLLAVFSGDFEGGGKTIALNSFAAAIVGEAFPATGVFGAIRGDSGAARSSVKNLAVNYAAPALAFAAADIRDAGVLAGSIENALVENINLTGALSVSCEAEGGLRVGGIGGYLENIVVKNVASSLAISAAGNELVHAGGVGCCLAGSSVTDSNATGDLSVRANRNNSTAAGSTVRRCYAAGAVNAQANGASSADLGGSLGVKRAANACGIAGAMYFNASSDGTTGTSGDIPNRLENCIALNSAVKGLDSSPAGGAGYSALRVAGDGIDGGMIRSKNYAWDMPMENWSGSAATKTHDGYDGANCNAKPPREFYATTLGWDFAGLWTMGSDGYSMLRSPMDP
jgi:hypothetical protein